MSNIGEYLEDIDNAWYAGFVAGIRARVIADIFLGIIIFAIWWNA